MGESSRPAGGGAAQEQMPDLHPGIPVEIHSPASSMNILARVADYGGGRITVEDPAGGEMPPVIYGQELEMTCYQRGKVYILNGAICGSTSRTWVLDGLTSIAVNEKRAFFRQPLRPPVEARCGRSSERRSEPCQLLDISGGGTCFTSRAEYQVGEELRLTEARIVPGAPPFSFSCVVRRASPGEAATRYQCQFLSISPREQDRLVQAIFAAQRAAIRDQRERSRNRGAT